MLMLLGSAAAQCKRDERNRSRLAAADDGAAEPPQRRAQTGIRDIGEAAVEHLRARRRRAGAAAAAADRPGASGGPCMSASRATAR